MPAVGEKWAIWRNYGAQVGEAFNNLDASGTVQANWRVNSKRRRVYGHNFSFVPVYMQSYFGSLFSQNSERFQQLLHGVRQNGQVIGKIDIYDGMISEFEPKAETWSGFCHNVIYDDIEELWGHCTSLAHPCRDLKERAAPTIYW